MIRVSGPGAIEVVTPLLQSPAPLAAFPSHTLRRVVVVDPESGHRLDEALCVVMRAPRSYTGEDVVELSCHGSPALLALVTRLIVARGARLAEPGEFTRRAFLNGRLDLAQAEAVALLIGARSDRAVALAARALAGGLSAPLAGLRSALLDLVAGLEVTLDFPEENVGVSTSTAAGTLAKLHDDAADLATRARRGRVVHEGLTVALVGPPNAGKSSLLNALLGRDRAIVSPVAGTTRDVVEGSMLLGGVPVRLLDTAGLGAPRDELDDAGMGRTRGAIAESDFLIVVFDGSVVLDAAMLLETAAHARLIVAAKSDLPAHPSVSAIDGALTVSAVTSAGMGTLVERLSDEVVRRAGEHGDEGMLVASLRQLEKLETLRTSLAAAHASLLAAPLEVALVDLRASLGAIAELLGEEVGDAVLDTIFSRFCLGK
ncbi:MAG: tRNA uridine-5-carboxymethylaminomethyl(34) synthesis GTPase MnmE [Candidatus Rokubacteria bacterium]|nr:tRNA uridine-5-carboxymethylaminomethyl(34) synthesis GTPase MnmE [Candidatus Rokubacteria bacterium]